MFEKYLYISNGFKIWIIPRGKGKYGECEW